MSDSPIDELTVVLDAIEITSDSSFSFAGEISITTNPLDALAASHDTVDLAVSQLQQILYQHCFCRKFTGSLERRQPTASPEDDLVDALAEANSGRDRWEQNWDIEHLLPSGQVVACKNGLCRSFWPGEFLNHERSGLRPQIGTRIDVFCPRQSLTFQPGFYFAFGEAVPDQQHDSQRVRFYWSIYAEGVVELVRAITQCLNRFQVPFHLKCLTTKSDYFRLDAAVLFVGRQYYRITAEVIGELYGKLRGHVRSDSPLFTRSIAPGLAIALDPGTGESFGMNRCGLVAKGVLNAYRQGLKGAATRLSEVKKQFAAADVRMEMPYLHGEISSDLEWPAFGSR